MLLNAWSINGLAIIAGLANGAFLAPISKTTKNISRIWLAFGVLTYLLFPLIVIILAVLTHQYHFNFVATMVMLLTGCVYGFGIYLLTLSVKYIGIGLPLAFNIALGMLSGSFFSTLIAQKFYLLANWLLILSYCCILIAIIFYSMALSKRDGNTPHNQWKKGLLLAVAGSLLCATQGACLSYYSDLIKSLGNNFSKQLIPWGLIFLGSAIGFISSKYIEYRKNQEKRIISKTRITLSALTMALLQIGSILLYTLANLHTRQYSQIYLWGIFMVCIILSSTFISYCKKEWSQSSIKANVFNATAITLLMISVILLSIFY